MPFYKFEFKFVLIFEDIDLFRDGIATNKSDPYGNYNVTYENLILLLSYLNLNTFCIYFTFIY